MKTLTARLIVFTVIIMIVLNGILIYLLWAKQSPRNQSRRPGFSEITEFIIKEMNFDAETSDQFRIIAKEHHENQQKHQLRYREIKGKLNQAMFNQHKVEADSLLNELAEVMKTKERELYRFFDEVSKITTEDQQRNFSRIFAEATRVPDYERIPMDGGAKRPPPPKR